MNSYKKTCLITNIGSHYRLPIFTKMWEEFGCDFYLGDKIDTPIKTFDYEALPGYKQKLHNVFFGKFYWQSKSARLLFKPYKNYIIVGEPYCLSSWTILILAKIMGKNVIAWTHGWYGRENILKRVVKKVFYSLPSKLLVYNEYAINLMRKAGIAQNKMFCIANSLDSDKEKSIRLTLSPSNVYSDHFKNNSPTIIYCGRIQKRKKLEQLIDSVKSLKEENVIINSIFVGSDVDGVNIMEYATKQGIQQQVWMYGPCYDDNMLGSLFYNAHLCVSPGNVGLTAILSLSFGCPTVTHNNFSNQMPEFEAIHPGITGDFFEQDNIEDLKEKIKKWISVTDEERERTRLQAYQEIDRKWNIHYQIEVLKQVLQ
jgi:glycosyltransferase involved in cell wall biosynthesis